MKHAAAVAIGSSPFVTFGALQVLGASQAPHWSDIADQFMDTHFWLTLWMVLLSGAFGGVSYELLLRQGAIELPHRVRRRGAVRRRYGSAPVEHLIALGIVGRAIVGSAAAAAALMVLAPSNAHAAIALGVTAGAAAPALIRLMRKQLLFAADLMSRMQSEAAPTRPRATALPVATATQPSMAGSSSRAA